MVGVFAGPQAESIMMLGRDNHHLHPGILKHPDPLPDIQLRRIKDGRVFGPVTPFAICKGIDGEMGKGNIFPLLPSQLPGMRQDMLLSADL